jgi:hypothetical protein
VKILLAIFFVGSVMLPAGAAFGAGAERTATGTIAKPGITAFMYGTHLLQDERGKTLYALKSTTINLDAYVGKKVTVSGELIPGYPLEGGPEYLNALSVH